MDYQITMTWNGKIVMQGEATAVVACETARAHMDQFAGPEWKAWEARNLYRSRILGELLEGRGVTLAFSDDTGAARVMIEPKEPKAAPMSQGDMLARGCWPVDMGA